MLKSCPMLRFYALADLIFRWCLIFCIQASRFLLHGSTTLNVRCLISEVIHPIKLENCVHLDMTGELVKMCCLLIGLNRVTQFEYPKVCHHTYTIIRNKLFSCKIYMRSVRNYDV